MRNPSKGAVDMPRKAPKSAFKSVLFMAVGALLTLAFMKTGYKPPPPLQWPGKLQALPHQLMAGHLLQDPQATLLQRQRAVATLIKHDPDYFITLDNSIDNRFTSRAINTIADRKLSLLKGYGRAVDKVLDGKQYPAIRKHLERRYGVADRAALKRKMMADQLRKEAFLYGILETRFPGASDEDIARKVLEGK